jgi:hypothetical protein
VRLLCELELVQCRSHPRRIVDPPAGWWVLFVCRDDPEDAGKG